jgi:hypothetical protein
MPNILNSLSFPRPPFAQLREKGRTAKAFGAHQRERVQESRQSALCSALRKKNLEIEKVFRYLSKYLNGG